MGYIHGRLVVKALQRMDQEAAEEPAQPDPREACRCSSYLALKANRDWHAGNAEALRKRLESVEQERDALRAALEDCAGGLHYIRSAYGDLYGVGWDRALNAADAALKGSH